MMKTTGRRTLCCSTTCEKRFECGRSVINNVGTYYVEDYSSFGSGTFTDNGCEIEHWCGKLGDYKMFEHIANKFDHLIENVKQGKLPPLNIKPKSVDGLVTHKNF